MIFNKRSFFPHKKVMNSPDFNHLIWILQVAGGKEKKLLLQRKPKNLFKKYFIKFVGWKYVRKVGLKHERKFKKRN